MKHLLRGTATRLRGNATQMAKRAMLRLGIVPPPFRLTIDITDRCNFRCPTCSKWQAVPSAEELTLGQWKSVFEKIGGVPLLREIAISGGEPFIRPDVFEILEMARQQGLRIVTISNGWFVDEGALQRLERIGLDCLTVSLNSLQEAVHDQSRGTRGSYQRIMQLIEVWRAQPRRTRLCLACIVMEPNCAELSSLAAFAQGKGLSGITFQVLAPPVAHYPFAAESHMPPSAEDWVVREPLWVRRVDILRREVSTLLRRQREGCPIMNPPSQLRNVLLYYEHPEAARKLPCLGTLSRMAIDPFGDIRLCYGYPPIGNVLHDEPRQVWRSAQAQHIRRASRRCTRWCRLLNNNL